MMQYRKAEIKDTNQLVSLRKEQLIDEGCFVEQDIDTSLQTYFTKGIASGEVIIWLAEENDKIIGTAGVCFFSYPPSFTNPTGRIAYITNVFTRPAYRRQAVATLLLNKIMEEIKNSDCRVARLHASREGRGLYEKIGFTDIDGFMMKRF